MKRLLVPGHLNPKSKGYSDVVIMNHCLKHNLRVIIEHHHGEDSIVSITDFKTGLHRKFAFDPINELINGMIIHHNVYLMLMDELKSEGLTMTRYNVEMQALNRDYPDAKPVDRHEVCLRLLTSEYA